MKRNTLESAIDKLNSHVVATETGCWELPGVKSRNKGYPSVFISGKQWRCSRAYYTFYKGDIPPGMLVCHTCDNIECVNPEHLFLGTFQDNTDDMLSKGRYTGKRGESSHYAKLTEADVVHIRERAAAGEDQREIAKDYGISYSNANLIATGYTWVDAGGPITRKGHVNPPVKKGEASHNAKLTEDDVREIRKLYAEGGISYENIGSRFGINATQVYRIVKRQRWAHVE